MRYLLRWHPKPYVFRKHFAVVSAWDQSHWSFGCRGATWKSGEPIVQWWLRHIPKHVYTYNSAFQTNQPGELYQVSKTLPLWPSPPLPLRPFHPSNIERVRNWSIWLYGFCPQRQCTPSVVVTRWHRFARMLCCFHGWHVCDAVKDCCYTTCVLLSAILSSFVLKKKTKKGSRAHHVNAMYKKITLQSDGEVQFVSLQLQPMAARF